MRFVLGGAPLDDAIAELILQVTGVFGVAPQPERNPLGLACRECFRLRVEIGAERAVNRSR